MSLFLKALLLSSHRFTPNSDRLNDILKPYFKAIKSLAFFNIYNRWSQKVFSTKDINAGWSGFVNGKITNESAFVWTLKATDSWPCL
jgi:gliding motility-associated-like protein